MNLIEFLFSLTRNLVLQVFVYVFIFFAAFTETAPIIGVFFPGVTLLLAGGFLASVGEMNLPILLAVSTLGALCGDVLGFHLGRRYGEKMLEKSKISRRSHNRLRSFLEKNVFFTIILSHFHGIPRAFTPLLAGSLKISYERFLSAATLGSFLFASFWVLLGYFAGESYETIQHSVNEIFTWIFLGSILIFLIYYLIFVRGK